MKVNFLSQLELFSINYDVTERKLQPLLIHLTVGKRAKRMPDTTVETTFVVVNFFWSNSNQFSVILIRSSELASLQLYYKLI